MPGYDGTGPLGQGPATGGGFGVCGYGRGIGFGQGMGRGFSRGMGRGFGRGMGRGFGRGMGRGFGRGMGRGFGFGPYGANYNEYTNIDEKTFLENEINYLKELKANLEKRKNELSE